MRAVMIRDGPQQWLEHIVDTMCRAQAWFRTGLTAVEISDRCGLPLPQVLTACRLGLAVGYIYVIGTKREGQVLALTAQGVAIGERSLKVGGISEEDRSALEDALEKILRSGEQGP